MEINISMMFLERLFFAGCGKNDVKQPSMHWITQKNNKNLHTFYDTRVFVLVKEFWPRK
jgi:hypothetical protein